MSNELENWIQSANLTLAQAEELRLIVNQVPSHVVLEQPSLHSIQPIQTEDNDEEWNPLNGPQTRYADLGLLGQGGMGQVRKVKDSRLGRVLAMKIMRRELLSNPREVQRFIEEAQVGAQLQHPAICSVYERDQFSSGEHYFTMPMVSGQRLVDVIRSVHHVSIDGQWKTSEDGWSFKRLLESFRKTCEAIAYAHNKGVVHRDLKPQNIMLSDFGQLLVMDWGLAKLVGTPLGECEIESDRQLATRPGAIIGTPAYMPPEQAFGDVDRVELRADVYSLGAILYEILCGEPPYQGKNQKEILNKMLLGPPKSLCVQKSTESPGRITSLDFLFGADSKPKIHSNPRPQPLIDICEHAMQLKPEDRFKNAGELYDALNSYLRRTKR